MGSTPSGHPRGLLRTECQHGRPASVRLALLLVLGGWLLAGPSAAAQNEPRKETVTLLGQKAKVWASSTLKAKDPRRYSVLNAFDGKPQTAWVEGAIGSGQGESITIEFPRPVTLSGFWLVPGYAKSQDVFLQNLAPADIALSVDDREVGKYTLRYVVQIDEKEPEPECRLVEDENNLAPRLVIFPQPISGQRVQLTLQDIAILSKKNKYDDLAISEWGLLSEKPSPTRPPARVARAAALLLDYARSGKLPRDFLAENAEVQDVLAPSKNIGTDWMQQGIHRELLKAGADSTKHPLENFETIARAALIGVPVTLAASVGGNDELQLVGSELFSTGDGEWVEYFPSIVLEGQKRIQWMGGIMGGDGAPGCHHVLPEEMVLMQR